MRRFSANKNHCELLYVTFKTIQNVTMIIEALKYEPLLQHNHVSKKQKKVWSPSIMDDDDDGVSNKKG